MTGLPRSGSVLRPFIIAAGVAVVAASCASTDRLPTLGTGSLSRTDALAAQEAYDRGLGRFQAGDYEGALEDFTVIVERYAASESSALALYWQARSFYQLGRDSLAIPGFERYLALAPGMPNREHAVLLLANSRYGTGDFDAALNAALDVGNAPDALRPGFLSLAGDLVDKLSRAQVIRGAQLDPPRDWMAPFYLQAARWSAADQNRRQAQQFADKVLDFPGLPADVRGEATAIRSGSEVALRPRIGVLMPGEGRFADVGEEVQRGVALALEEINRDRTNAYELVSRVTITDADSTVAMVRALARGEGVQAILGPITSEFALPAGEAAREEGVALISPTATDARMLDIGPNVLTVNALDGAIGYTIGTYAATNLGRRRFAILAVDNPYGRIQADAFAQAVQAAGGGIVARHTYAPATTQFTELLGEIVRSGTDALFIATKSPNEALRILNQVAFFQLGSLMPLGTDAWNDASFSSQGRGFVRGYFADTFSRDPRVTRWQAFADAYTARYGEEPENLIPGWGYDAAHLAIRPFVQQNAATGATALAAEPYRGASALFRFTPQGIRRAVVVHQIQGGEAVAVEW
ncbi:MAG TPA: penicillin-binding protein activator [Gemmatimonadota bacterium]|nr:penicillin-binding protein activator [Gemmatimonadota bacterium]